MALATDAKEVGVGGPQKKRSADQSQTYLSNAARISKSETETAIMHGLSGKLDEGLWRSGVG